MQTVSRCLSLVLCSSSRTTRRGSVASELSPLPGPTESFYFSTVRLLLAAVLPLLCPRLSLHSGQVGARAWVLSLGDWWHTELPEARWSCSLLRSDFPNQAAHSPGTATPFGKHKLLVAEQSKGQSFAPSSREVWSCFCFPWRAASMPTPLLVKRRAGWTIPKGPGLAPLCPPQFPECPRNGPCATRESQQGGGFA